MPRLWTVLPGEGPIVIVLLLTGAVGMPPHSACVWPKIVNAKAMRVVPLG